MVKEVKIYRLEKSRATTPWANLDQKSVELLFKKIVGLQYLLQN